MSANSRWQIDKTFEFCYGHRVWTQQLDNRFANDLKCACRFLHGHEGKVQVFLEGSTLNQQGMVTDFRHLEWLKRWINENIDHRFILDRNDPLFPVLFPGAVLHEVRLSVEGQPSIFAGHRITNADTPESQATSEMMEGVLVVEFPPTSEHLAAWLHGLVQHAMQPLGVRVPRIDWWETPKSRSSFMA